MKNIKKFIQERFNKAIELKEMFKSLENKEWNSLTVLLELNVQISHIYNVLNSSVDIDEDGRHINNIGDEISDILLQLLYLSYLEDIDFNIVDKYKDYTYDKLEGLSVVFGQLTEILLEKYDYRFTKPRPGFETPKDFITDRIIKMFIIVANIADKYSIDIIKEFDLMYEDATDFIKESIGE